MAIGIERETPMTHYIESTSSNKTNVTFSGKDIFLFIDLRNG